MGCGLTLAVPKRAAERLAELLDSSDEAARVTYIISASRVSSGTG